MWVRDCIDSWQQRRCFRYLIYDTQSGDILGAAGLEKIAWTHGIAELGYWVAVDAINQGVATAAAALAVQQGFAVHGLNRIEINVLCDNGPSMQVAEKIGAVLEGCFRNKLFHEGQSRAANCYSLIPSDCSIRR